MPQNSNWKPVDLKKQGFDTDPRQKPMIEGAGPFFDENGRSDISGNSLRRSWRSGSVYFLCVFTLVWNSFIAIFIGGTWNGRVTVNGTHHTSMQQALQADPTAYIFVIFPIVGLILAYITLALLINKTHIQFQTGKLIVSKGPLPWYPKQLVLTTDSIRQVYIQEYSSHSENKRPVIAFRVMAQTSTGNDVCIENGLSTYSSARILEQWLEKKLRIEDRFVPGEVGT